MSLNETRIIALLESISVSRYYAIMLSYSDIANDLKNSKYLAFYSGRKCAA